MSATRPLLAIFLLLTLFLAAVTPANAQWPLPNHRDHAKKLYEKSHTMVSAIPVGSYKLDTRRTLADDPVLLESFRQAQKNGVLYFRKKSFVGKTYLATVVSGGAAQKLYDRYLRPASSSLPPVAAPSRSLTRFSSLPARAGLGMHDTPVPEATMEALVSWNHDNGETKPFAIDFYRSSASSYTFKDFPRELPNSVINSPIFKAVKP